MTVRIDKYTKEQAAEYADNECEVSGAPIGGSMWKGHYGEYLEEAKGTMSVGRNPRTARNPVSSAAVMYNDILGKSGLAGKLASNYKSKSGKGVPVDVIQNRIMSSVLNIVKLYENSVLGVKTTTVGDKQGRIEASAMSDLQMPPRPKDMTDEQYAVLARAVVKQQMTRDLLTNMMLENLIPFFNLQKQSVDKIMAATSLDDAKLEDLQKPGLRKEWVKQLRAVVGKRLRSIDFRQLLLFKGGKSDQDNMEESSAS